MNERKVFRGVLFTIAVTVGWSGVLNAQESINCLIANVCTKPGEGETKADAIRKCRELATGGAVQLGVYSAGMVVPEGEDNTPPLGAPGGYCPTGGLTCKGAPPETVRWYCIGLHQTEPPDED